MPAPRCDGVTAAFFTLPARCVRIGPRTFTVRHGCGDYARSAMRPHVKPDSFEAAVVLVVALHLLASLLVALAGVPTFLFAHPTPGQRALVWLGLCSGPLSGWVLAFSQRAGSSALPMLATVSVVCAAPLALALARRSLGALLVGGVFWFLSGYLFVIAIWV